MEKGTSRYMLQVEGLERAGEVVKDFNQSSGHQTLKAAFDALQALGNAAFDAGAFDERKLPKFLKDCIITDLIDHVPILLKHQLYENDIDGIPAGVYFKLNVKKMNPSQFTAETGFELKDEALKGKATGYFPSIDPALKREALKLKNLLAGFRNRWQGNKGKGRSL